MVLESLNCVVRILLTSNGGPVTQIEPWLLPDWPLKHGTGLWSRLLTNIEAEGKGKFETAKDGSGSWLLCSVGHVYHCKTSTHIKSELCMTQC